MDKTYTIYLKSGAVVRIDAQAVKVKEDGTVALAQSTESNIRISYLDPSSIECIVVEQPENLEE